MSLKRHVDVFRLCLDILTIALALSLVILREQWAIKILSMLVLPLLMWDITITLKRKGKSWKKRKQTRE